MRTGNLEAIRHYLENFEEFHSGESSFFDYWNQNEANSSVALDTVVHHSRGGSGSYYRYELLPVTAHLT